jgi:hypothetical protein
MKRMSFNMTENELNEALLRLYKSIAEMTRDILAISDASSDISTAATRVTLAFDHHSLRISVYHSCRACAREYVEISSVIKISFYRRQILYSVHNNKYFFNHMNNQNAK